MDGLDLLLQYHSYTALVNSKTSTRYSLQWIKSHCYSHRIILLCRLLTLLQQVRQSRPINNVNFGSVIPTIPINRPLYTNIKYSRLISVPHAQDCRLIIHRVTQYDRFLFDGTWSIVDNDQCNPNFVATLSICSCPKRLNISYHVSSTNSNIFFLDLVFVFWTSYCVLKIFINVDFFL
jgi:hypothetical protein